MKKTLVLCFLYVLYFSNTKSCFAFEKSLDKQDFNTYYYKSTRNESLKNVLDKRFIFAKSNILTKGLDKSYFWIKLVLRKDLNKVNILWIDQPRLDNTNLYVIKYNGKNKSINAVPTYSAKLKHFMGKAYMLPKNLQKGSSIFISTKAKEIFSIPISILNEDTVTDSLFFRAIIFGIYTGIMLIMFAYNLFVFFIIKDKSYIFYVFYILSTWLTQITIQGYSSQYFWKENSLFDNYSIVILSNIALIFACLFTNTFLNTKVYFRLSNQIIYVLSALAFINIFIPFILNNHVAFIIMQLLTLSSSVIALFTAYFVYFKKHFKPAGYYLVAWSILLLGAIFFILKDYGIVPYNNFTIYLLQIASAIEVMLLSFALADKINFFKKENEAAQTQALNASLKNQELIQQQNIYLEENVKKRTEELQNTNATLNITLNNLKNAQSQLVDAEKMAALGQLTAGIAHEINNPINFVTSNIKPLELDINDLKEVITQYEEIDYTKDIPQQLEKINAFKKQIDIKFVNQEISSLLAGITEGAKRTAEIIRSLKSFSRVDETDIKPVDLNEGIKSTLILLRNSLPDNLIVVADYGNLPNVECFPGKINQVFMNLISNAIHAIKNKENQNQEEYLTVKTWFENDKVKISIKDTGTGMTEEVKHRIFEPFFTTKEIGEGTGLGLSIVFGIIEKHKGHIDVISNYGEGTEFIITLNIYQK